MDESPSMVDTFKKPTIPVDSFKKPCIPVQSETNKLNENLPKENESESVTTNNKSTPLKVAKTLTTVPLPYQEPEWSGHPPENFSLEIIKNGTFVKTLPIKSSLVVFGRLDICDVIFEHPSVSRFHAVIQYCKGDDSHPRGFYLYDLNSTHGTFLNKEKVKPKIYYKLKVGYILKFGGSSRLHIFQGPEEEEEVEKKEPKVSAETAEDGCDWGMGEEAEEEEDLSVNPYSLLAPNEEHYVDDPKKTLRGWFEREGYELEYNVEEKGFQTFSCTIKLPVDTEFGDYLPVEASVKGKKKEAVIACALEACRTLDKMGLLRQSHHESRQPKRKKWEENDYYDSDEDTFYDRSGEIEKRREMRKKLAKKVEVDNYESLTAKLQKLNAEMDLIKAKIDQNVNRSSDADSKESDPLDMYMSNLSETSSSVSDKFEKRKLKLRLIELEKEKSRLEKLSDIAKPAVLPPIAKRPGIIGKKLKSKLNLTSVTKSEPVQSKSNDGQVEEVDSDDESKNTVKNKEDNSLKAESSGITTSKYGLILNPSGEQEISNVKEFEDKLMDCDSENQIPKTAEPGDDKPTSPKEKQIHSKNDSFKTKTTLNIDSSSSDKLDPTHSTDSKIFSSSTNSAKSNVSSKKKKGNSSKVKDVDVYKTSSSEYCTWIPPSNQSGDGMTHLNEKFGY